MGQDSYFFDTYALIEILKENANYKRFTTESVTMTIFNLAELYWSVLKDYGPTKADAVFNQYKPSVVDVDDETLKAAMQFKKTHKKIRLSYADCIGYVYAKRHDMKFLTGDKEFHDLPNVAFVK